MILLTVFVLCDGVTDDSSGICESFMKFKDFVKEPM